MDARHAGATADDRWRLRATAAALVLVSLVGAVSAGCESGEMSPADVVDRYFRFLARDPIRTLPLLTPEFHVQHGLHVVTTAEARQYVRGESGPSLPPGPDTAARPYAQDRLELAWLGVQMREPFRALRDRLRVSPIEQTEDGDRASVVVRVQAGAGRGFRQRFVLVREAAGRPWRIDAIEQEEVAPEDLTAAFVAHPTEAARVSLERALRR